MESKCEHAARTYTKTVEDLGMNQYGDEEIVLIKYYTCLTCGKELSEAFSMSTTKEGILDVCVDILKKTMQLELDANIAILKKLQELRQEIRNELEG